jgi:hypothetical protein
LKLEHRSLKSKEKFADSLMSLANIIHGAVLIGVFVFPLTAFVSALFAGTEPFSFFAILDRMSWSSIGVFGVVYFLPGLVGLYAKTKAMDLYDEVAQSTLSSAIERPLKRCYRSKRRMG